MRHPFLSLTPILFALCSLPALGKEGHANGLPESDKNCATQISGGRTIARAIDNRTGLATEEVVIENGKLASVKGKDRGAVARDCTPTVRATLPRPMADAVLRASTTK